MLCKIADLITEVPEAGGMAPRCREYLWNGEAGADIIIRTDLYRKNHYGTHLSEENLAYMESAYQFYLQLVKHKGFYLHASAVEMNGYAYLFSGPCGAGKSTHTRLWQQVFGIAAQVFNDDKPALRYLDNKWYAYGTPWCGKDGINQNKKVPLAGICFLEQDSKNAIRRLNEAEAAQRILGQTIFRFSQRESLDAMLNSLNCLIQAVPVFELSNRPEPQAAELSFYTMSNAIQEKAL